MAMTRIPGSGLWVPPVFAGGLGASSGHNSTAINSQTVRVASVGRLWWADRAATKNLQKISFQFGMVTKSGGGSNLRVSLQNLTPGPPPTPTGTILQSFTIANADGNFSAFAQYPMTAFPAVQAVNFGQQIAVVWESPNWAASDSFTLATTVTQQGDGYNFPLFYNGTSWAVMGLNSWASVGNVLFQCDDGSYAVFDSCTTPNLFLNQPQPTLSTTNQVNITPDLGMTYQLPFGHSIDAIAWYGYFTAGATGSINLYDMPSSTVLGSWNVAGTSAPNNASSNAFQFMEIFPEIVLAANHQYNITIKGTNSNNVAVGNYTPGNNAYMTVMSMGTNCYWATRQMGGVWVYDQTRRALISFRISSVDAGSVINLFTVED